MSLDNQIRGMLLEEALLYLLKSAGYDTVETHRKDPTLRSGPSGLIVKGRGADHQIDAIADHQISHPFSNPQRLLVEAKCFQGNSGLSIIRNAVGVYKDVCEHWVSRSRKGSGLRRRYHYQYAVFSANGYTEDAESYAFAHDIFLIPLGRSAFIKPIIESIYSLNESHFPQLTNPAAKTPLKKLRRKVRKRLKEIRDTQGIPPNWTNDALSGFFQACNAINGVLLAVMGGNFPVFLVPKTGRSLQNLDYELKITIHYDRLRESWFIRRSGSMEDIFSFDVPEKLFRLYSSNGTLTRQQAIELKQTAMSSFQALYRSREQVKLITLTLDEDWIKVIKREIPDRREILDENTEG